MWELCRTQNFRQQGVMSEASILITLSYYSQYWREAIRSFRLTFEVLVIQNVRIAVLFPATWKNSSWRISWLWTWRRFRWGRIGGRRHWRRHRFWWQFRWVGFTTPIFLSAIHHRESWAAERWSASWKWLSFKIWGRKSLSVIEKLHLAWQRYPKWRFSICTRWDYLLLLKPATP